jgi:hypothetical protein
MKYFVKSDGETAEDAKELRDNSVSLDVVTFAEDAAEYYHDNCDGWESSWPIMFTIIDDRGEEHDVSVDRDFDPTFSGVLRKSTTND